MSIHGLYRSGLLTLTLALACGSQSANAVPPGTFTNVAPMLRCPDPTTDCTMSNGTGVYYQEDGSGGIQTAHLQFLITHFTNESGKSVSFQGRYYDPTENLWKTLPADGSVAMARFGGQRYAVVSVTETGTVPTWTLARGGGELQVSGNQLLRLVLELTLPDPLADPTFRVAAPPPLAYRLDFTGPVLEQTGHGTTVHGYRMRWSEGTLDKVPSWYCLDFQGQPDAVVFQQGIRVNALNGVVTRDADSAKLVTISCSLGAPATVYGWGYDYRSVAGEFYFASAIQMKRASYCGNRRFFTQRGTQIAIADDAKIEDDPHTADEVEAYWTPSGARCLGKRRHPELKFSGACDGQPLVACEDLGPVSGPWLLDAVHEN